MQAVPDRPLPGLPQQPGADAPAAGRGEHPDHHLGGRLVPAEQAARQLHVSGQLAAGLGHDHHRVARPRQLAQLAGHRIRRRVPLGGLQQHERRLPVQPLLQPQQRRSVAGTRGTDRDISQAATGRPAWFP